MSKHTPGSWEAVMPDDPRGQPVPYYRAGVCVMSGEPSIAVVRKDGLPCPAGEWKANAHLVAAAPDYYAAGESLLCWQRMLHREQRQAHQGATEQEFREWLTPSFQMLYDAHTKAKGE